MKKQLLIDKKGLILHSSIELKELKKLAILFILGLLLLQNEKAIFYHLIR